MRAGVAYPEFHVDADGRRYRVAKRVPFSLQATLVVGPASRPMIMPAGEFSNGLDQPFEIDTIVPRATMVDEEGVPEADPVPTIFDFFRVGFLAQNLTQEFQNQLVRARALLEADELVWYIVPTTLENSQAFIVTVQNDHPTSNMRIEVTLRGHNLLLTPAD